VPRWGARKITLFDLATHTSGLPRDLELGKISEARLYDALSHCRLAREPGRKVEYSNLGVLLLGHVIQLKAGTNYEALLQERICGPLHMDSTCIRTTPALRARLAKSHGGENRPAGDLADELAPLPGCGAIRSTANDMLKYVAANLGLTGSPLRPLMEKTHVVRFPHAMEEIDFAMPWWVYHRRGAELITHGGTTRGHQAFIGFDKRAKRGVVVLANREDVLEQAVKPLGMYLLSPPPEPVVRVKVAREILDSYAGLYEIPDYLQVLLTLRRQGDELRAQLMSSPAMPGCVPVSDTEYADLWGSGSQTNLRASVPAPQKVAGSAALLHDRASRSLGVGKPRSSSSARAPCRGGILPLVVRQLRHLAPVTAHHKQLAIGLRSPFIQHGLILEALAGAAEHDPVPSGRPDGMSVVPVAVGQLPHVRAVRPYRVYVVIRFAETAEHDAIPAQRPCRKSVILAGESRDLTGLQREDTQSLLAISHHPMY